VYDSDGRLTSWEFRNGTSILRNNVSWDVASRVTANANPVDATLGCVFQYDALDRLTVSQQGNPVGTTRQFGYDAVGNRSNLTVNGTLTNYSYAAASNQLLALTGGTAKSYVYDAAGNPTTIGSLAYTYNNANRLVKVMNGSTTVATYKVNALGQRLEKVSSGVTTRYVYDEQGHLLGEYDSTGKLIQETVWLEDLPVATLRPTGASGTPTPINVYYVLADHLGSPRAVVRPSDNKIMWRWDNAEPFGANAANENPAGGGTFKYALRFPGQYYDAETATHYNYYRDYDPQIGRYAESDPIGLMGGINTYAYVRSNPTRRSDRRGLDNPGLGPYDPPLGWVNPSSPAIMFRSPRRAAPACYCPSPDQLTPGDAIFGSMLAGAGVFGVLGLGLGIEMTGAEIGGAAGLIGFAGAAAVAGKATMTGIVIGGAVGAVVGITVAGVVIVAQQTPRQDPCTAPCSCP
jgi:RHS repeat-associated protein